METGHFTQVVWKSSAKLGIGKSTAKKGNMMCTYIVGRYRPPGNFMGQFQKEVLQGTYSKDVCGKLADMIKDLSNIPGAGIPPKGGPVSDPSVAQDSLKKPSAKGRVNFSPKYSIIFC